MIGTLRRFSNSNVLSYKRKGALAFGRVGVQGKTYDDHLLARGLSESLGPSDLSRVTLHLEVLVTSDEAQGSVSV